jgi:FAD/FMN-containing dehydrogenase
VPVTFRAAGTSLSGQAITDSVLLKLSHTGKNFRNYEIHVSDGAARRGGAADGGGGAARRGDAAAGPRQVSEAPPVP